MSNTNKPLIEMSEDAEAAKKRSDEQQAIFRAVANHMRTKDFVSVGPDGSTEGTDEFKKRTGWGGESILNGFVITGHIVRPFDEVWKDYEAKGYRYGEDALEQVRFGYEIALKEMKIGLKP